MASKTHVFVSFQHKDVQRARGFRLLNLNPNTDIDFVEHSFIEPVKSKDRAYISQRVRENIKKCDVLTVLIGKETKNSEWIRSEVSWAREMGVPVLGIHLKNQGGEVPAVLRENGCRVIDWEPSEFQQAIRRTAKLGPAGKAALSSDPNAGNC